LIARTNPVALEKQIPRPDTPQLQEFDFHWQQTQQHTTDISDLREGQARLEVGMSSLGDRVQSGFSSLQATLQERTQPIPPTPWIPVAGLIISTIVVLGTILGFTFGLITDGMQRENDLRFNYVRAELEKIDEQREADNIRVQDLAIRLGKD
jgi:hypothetical protein